MNRMERAALVGGLVAVALVAAIPATSSATTDPQPPSEPPAAAVDPAAPTTDSTATAALATDAASRHDDDVAPPIRPRRPRRAPTTSTTTTTTTSAPTTSSAPTVVPPSEPVAPAASPGNASATLSWGAPWPTAVRRSPTTSSSGRRTVRRTGRRPRRDFAGPDDHRVWSDQRGDPLLPGARREHRRIRIAQPRRQRGAADRGVRAVDVDGDADERVGPGSPVVAGAGLQRRLSDHRLRRPALAERHVRLDDDHRRGEHGDGLHRDRPGQRHPLLLPGPRPQRRRLSPSSNIVNAIPRTIPTAVRSLSRHAGGVRGRSGWRGWRPPSNGGSAITDYLIQRSPNGTSGWVTINDGVQHDDRLHRDRAAQRHPLLLPGLPAQRRRLRAGEQRRQPDPASGPDCRALAHRRADERVGSGAVVVAGAGINGGTAITDYVIQRSTNGSPAG